MARGDAQLAFAEAAAADGVVLERQPHSWLTERGHLGLPASAASARDALEVIYLALGGDLTALSTARDRCLPSDFIHRPTGTLIEVDESQHFTSARLMSLELYPPAAPLGFDLDVYKEACRHWGRDADSYFSKKPARGFGEGGRQRQRAYYDALRDLAAPAMGHPPVIRIACPYRNGQVAYANNRVALLTALGLAS